jgi:hypothetical protein
MFSMVLGPKKVTILGGEFLPKELELFTKYESPFESGHNLSFSSE